MFSFFTYPHKVVAALQSRGWSVNDLPPPSSREWLATIHGLRKAGVSPDQAAAWFGSAFRGDKDALRQIIENGGVQAMFLFEGVSFE